MAGFETLRFVDALEEDLPAIVEIYNSTVASRLVTADTEPVTVESRLPWFRDHAPDRRPLWKIQDPTGLLVGWVSFQSFYGRPGYDTTAEISLYLAPDQRGKGYGKAALLYAIRRSPDFGLRNLLGFIFARNTPSMRLFSQFGFQPWGRLPGVALLDNQEEDLIIMGLRLISPAD